VFGPGAVVKPRTSVIAHPKTPLRSAPLNIVRDENPRVYAWVEKSSAHAAGRHPASNPHPPLRDRLERRADIPPPPPTEHPALSAFRSMLAAMSVCDWLAAKRHRQELNKLGFNVIVRPHWGGRDGVR
jgi:hypothetical protein